MTTFDSAKVHKDLRDQVADREQRAAAHGMTLEQMYAVDRCLAVCRANNCRTKDQADNRARDHWFNDSGAQKCFKTYKVFGVAVRACFVEPQTQYVSRGLMRTKDIRSGDLVHLDGDWRVINSINDIGHKVYLSWGLSGLWLSPDSCHSTYVPA